MSQTKHRFKVAIIAPTCFYYQTALFRELAAHPRIDLTVYFCSDEGLSARDVQAMYKVDVPWIGRDELLEGYRYKFLRNFSPQPSYLKWPLGLINIGILKEIIVGRPDVVVLMSWMNPTWWMALAACVISRTPFFYMTDANVQIEPFRSKRKRQIKRIVLGALLFRLSAGFLCAGTANRDFYKLYGVPDKKLFPFAYSWGYKPLFERSEELKPQRNHIRAELGISDESLVVLYCGRLSTEKNLFHLVDAYHKLEDDRKTLIFVGDGELRQSLENYVDEIGVESVHFFGFQNRNQIARYYAISDWIVLASIRETWGIVVNEAMCFGLPVIVSHQVGAGIDLVSHGWNGYHVGIDDDALARCMSEIARLPEADRWQMGARSLDTMKAWSHRDLAEALVRNIEYTRGQRPGPASNF